MTDLTTPMPGAGAARAASPAPAPVAAPVAAPPDDATRAQHAAADPARSTWLTANAGSGKTKVLTDRVARLLLDGTRPERILCLTYTKAAASEMQNRLLGQLGAWAMLPDADLRRDLAALGMPDLPDLARARRLFAQAIETPGGLKVQTIHSFCAAILRRFPLEAGVPQGFAELDDRSAAHLRAEILEEMARDADPGFAALLTLHPGHDLDRFLAGLRGFDAPPDADEIWRAAGLVPGTSAAALAARVFEGGGGATIAALIPHLLKSNKTDQGAAADWAGLDWTAPGPVEAAALEGVLLYKSGDKAGAAKYDKFPAVALQRGACAALMDELTDLMGRVESARTARLALAHAERTLALHRFGHAFGARYAVAKAAQGWLDFDDLIVLTARLLSDGAMAQWVLFRLDGGIDHILVDEAQDTSPGQWQVIEHLTGEFTAGQGAHDTPRTLFVVGDPKQSIYSFQGADIAVFEARRDGFSAAFAAADRPIQHAALRHSFRSSTAILSLVDAVFQGDAAEGLGGAPAHIPFRSALPGRVELWPPVPDPDKPEPMPWDTPVDRPAPNSAERVLAEAVAARVAALRGQPIPDVRSGTLRPIRAGDVLVLVQRRKGLFHELIAALKRQGLPVAGADRLKLAAELAVRDIRALLSFLATPEDDLSLAAALRSPLFGLDEGALYDLAAPRRGYLWQALRESGGHPGVMAILDDLMGQADYLRPYDLIARLLIRHEGRARLVARLGREAEDGIDELLAQALTYEGSETPSLTGFLVWLSDDDIEVRRQPGAAGAGEGVVRVMTVHGAKGLESPIVILPDTARREDRNRAQTLTPPEGGPPVWRGTKGERPDEVEDWIARETALRAEESRRLLYVALTRAESWLIVAAAGETGSGIESWHAMVAEGLARTPALTAATEPAPWGGEIRRLSFGDWPEAAAALTPEAPPAGTNPSRAPSGTADAPEPPPASAPAVPPAPAEAPALPGWVHSLPPAPVRPPRALAATALGGAKALVPLGALADADRQAAMLAGTRLHLLLELLPGLDRADWPAEASAALAGAEGGLPDAATLAALLAEAARVIDAEALAEVFAPDGATVLREVPLTADLPGIGRIAGAIDRLLVTPERVTIVDYKSNALIPETPEAVPEGILRQMAAYRAALAGLYPGRAVVAQVLWTQGPVLMALPEALLDAALDRARSALAGLDPMRGRA